MTGKSRVKTAGILVMALLVSVGQATNEEGGPVDFETLARHYYINPQPHMAPAAARSFLSSRLSAGDESCDYDCRYSAAYAFGRIGQLDPNVVPEYQVRFAGGNHAQRLFMLDVLRLCGTRQTEEFFTSRLKAGRFINEGRRIRQVLAQGMPVEFDPIDNPIESRLDVELLWRKFTITGSEDAVRRIISVLGWLYEGNEIEAIIAGTTKWSLSENCREHSTVSQICREELAKSTDSTRRVLEEIIDDLEILEILNRLERRDNLTESGDGKMTTEDLRQSTATGPKAWALGCSAVLSEVNYDRHDLLAGGEINWKNIGRTKKLIKRWWGITTRAELFSELLWLNADGHRKRFDVVGVYIIAISDDGYKEFLETYNDEQEMLQEIEITRQHYSELRGRGISGWDYARFISLCRWGYMVGHLGEDEVWELIMPVARVLQKRFDSWEDLGRNYLIGREFWSYKRTKQTGYKCEDAYRRLLDMRSSPWNEYPWDMDLTDAITTNHVGEAKPTKER